MITNKLERKNVIILGVIMMLLCIGCRNDDECIPPVIVTVEDLSVTITENPEKGQVLGTVKAGTSSGEISFTLTSQSSADAMQVNATTGELKVKTTSIFDFETRKLVTGIVTVKSGEVSKEAKVTITISAINDEAPVIATQTFVAKEDIADDVVIGTITATDKDNDALTFILTQNSNDLFELTDAGVLSLVAGKTLDFENIPSHQLTVEVSDGLLKTSASIIVTVENTIEPFITTWQTTMANEEINFGINTRNFTYDYTIDWGDGTIEYNQTTPGRHTYATAGTYTVSISGAFPAFQINSQQISGDQLKTIEAWGDQVWESMNRAFESCSNMKYNATDIPDLSRVTDMGAMFEFASSFNGDLSGWDVSMVTDMGFMFSGASSFNGDLSGWDVSMVTYMGGMLDNTNISVENYDKLLTQWATLSNLQTGVSFGVQGLMYCKASDARESLIANKDWTIRGDNISCP